MENHKEVVLNKLCNELCNCQICYLKLNRNSNDPFKIESNGKTEKKLIIKYTNKHNITPTHTNVLKELVILKT